MWTHEKSLPLCLTSCLSGSPPHIFQIIPFSTSAGVRGSDSTYFVLVLSVGSSIDILRPILLNPLSSFTPQHACEIAVKVVSDLSFLSWLITYCNNCAAVIRIDLSPSYLQCFTIRSS